MFSSKFKVILTSYFTFVISVGKIFVQFPDNVDIIFQKYFFKSASKWLGVCITFVLVGDRCRVIV